MTADTPGSPLVLTRDPALAEDVLRLAAAAGVTPEVVGEPAAIRRRWGPAPLVLVGSDLAAAVAAESPVRREAVHVVARGEVPDTMFRTALALGAERVATLPRSEEWLVELLTDVSEGVDRPGRVIGVIGGSGGAGASTFAAALAAIAAERDPTLAVDLDPLGPGLDRVLGMEGIDGIRWDALQQTTGRLGARSLRDALPRRGHLGVLTWAAGGSGPLALFAVREVLSAARRGHRTVVVDLPRTLDPLVEEVAAGCDDLLVVTLPSLVGMSAAARICARLDLPHLAHVVRGVLPDPQPVTRMTGRPVLITMRDQRGVTEAIDLGVGPVRGGRNALARAARDVLARLGPGERP